MCFTNNNYFLSGLKSLMLNRLTFPNAFNSGNCKDDGTVLLLDNVRMLLDPNDKDVLAAEEQLIVKLRANNIELDSTARLILSHTTDSLGKLI